MLGTIGRRGFGEVGWGGWGGGQQVEAMFSGSREVSFRWHIFFLHVGSRKNCDVISLGGRFSPARLRTEGGSGRGRKRGGWRRQRHVVHYRVVAESLDSCARIEISSTQCACARSKRRKKRVKSYLRVFCSAACLHMKFFFCVCLLGSTILLHMLRRDLSPSRRIGSCDRIADINLNWSQPAAKSSK